MRVTPSRLPERRLRMFNATRGDSQRSCAAPAEVNTAAPKMCTGHGEVASLFDGRRGAPAWTRCHPPGGVGYTSVGGGDQGATPQVPPLAFLLGP